MAHKGENRVFSQLRLSTTHKPKENDVVTIVENETHHRFGIRGRRRDVEAPTPLAIPLRRQRRSTPKRRRRTRRRFEAHLKRRVVPTQTRRRRVRRLGPTRRCSVSRLSLKCRDSTLRSFDRVFTEFADSGFDPHSWTLTTPKEIEAKHKRMERYVTLTATLHRELDELSLLEGALRKALHNNNNNDKDHHKICDLQHKIFWQKQEVKNLKEKSLWNKGFDSVVLLLARFVFTVLARIKVVFGIGHRVPYLSRSLSASATVYPSDHQNPTSNNSCNFVSGPLKSSKLEEKKEDLGSGFFESNCKVLKPQQGTLGASALALHYANLIIVMEKMIKSPQLVGLDARDDLYAMLPSSIRLSLRLRLKGSIGFSACDPVLAGEWRDALGRILLWLSPLAHNMIKWQSERSFEQQKSNLVPKTNNVLLLQTLYFANKEKTEAAITELLVGLNYVWRFEREMTAKALFQCTNHFNRLLSLHKSAKDT